MEKLTVMLDNGMKLIINSKSDPRNVQLFDKVIRKAEH